MSTLKTSNIQDTSGNNNSTPEEISQGRAKAWVNFNGTGTVAIRDSFNVSSITDNGTGDYTITFANAMANVNYSFHGTASQAGTGNNGQTLSILASTAPTTTTVQFRTQQDNVGVTDSEYVCIVVFGD